MDFFNRPSLLVFQSEPQQELTNCLDPRKIRNLCRVGKIEARFLGVVADVIGGKVYNLSWKAPSYQIIYLPREQCNTQAYRKLVKDSAAQFFLFFNWNNPITGLDSRTRFCNRNAFEIVIEEDEGSHSVLMRFVQGPVFFEASLPDLKELWSQLQGDLSRTISLVVQGKITWDGKNYKSLRVPEGFSSASLTGEKSRDRKIA